MSQWLSRIVREVADYFQLGIPDFAIAEFQDQSGIYLDCLGRLSAVRSRTPGPPPFSSMNSMPAALERATNHMGRFRRDGPSRTLKVDNSRES